MQFRDSCGNLARWTKFLTRFSLAEMIALTDTIGVVGMLPPTNTKIYARLKRVQEHGSRVNAADAQDSGHNEGPHASTQRLL